MNAADQRDPVRGILLLLIMRRAGLKVRLDGDDIVVRGRLTDEQRRFIKANRETILLALAVELFEPRRIWINRREYLYPSPEDSAQN